MENLFEGRPREEPLDWTLMARQFDAFVMNPSNGVSFTNARGERASTAFLEGKTGPHAAHELVAYGPVVLGKLLLGHDVSDLLPSLAGYFNESVGTYMNHAADARMEMWYLMYALSLAAHITLKAVPRDVPAMVRLRSSLECLRKLARSLNRDFNHQGYDFVADRPWTDQDIYRQPDALGAYAYLMLLGYEHFGVGDWREEASKALALYLGLPKNPWYEVPSGVMATLAAARLSALGASFDVAKALELVLDPNAGLVIGEWGGREVNGLYRGWRHSTPESAYSLESLMPLPFLLPAARYQPRLARTIARYALHAASNARLFYSAYTAGSESRPDLDPSVAYERLYREHQGKTPYAAGDFAGHKSIYGGAYALWWGALVKQTEVPFVLRLDLTLTDFLQPDAPPASLFYNPWNTARSVSRDGDGATDLEIPPDSILVVDANSDVRSLF